MVPLARAGRSQTATSACPLVHRAMHEKQVARRTRLAGVRVKHTPKSPFPATIARPTAAESVRATCAEPDSMLADPSEHCSFTAGDAEPILDVQRGSTYLACLSERHLYLWSCGQRCELLCRQTADDAVPPYRRCVWHPDGDALAVLSVVGMLRSA